MIEIREARFVLGTELAVERRERGQPAIDVAEQRAEVEISGGVESAFVREPCRGLEGEVKPTVSWLAGDDVEGAMGIGELPGVFNVDFAPTKPLRGVRKLAA
ncbi:hypothetical protein SCE1572_33955 [Sorangium cellulosum So0157-2]|uniref:Uncharacterized protein n=1 Tax=Sorangium cellulosum So0157-2 TaxID=1254432 RepID=S4Y3L6_SORCE|nr:hypothetical protein SCE1572_33955 [Sorangium cellulosum So0157-2]